VYIVTRRANGAALVAAASAVPSECVPTADIEDRLGVQRGWVVSRTGVRQRYRALPDERLTELAALAARRALDRAGVPPAKVDMVLVATMTPEPGTPALAPLIARAVASETTAAMDIGAACSGFLSALSMASASIESGRAGCVLVVGADLMSRVLDYDDRVTAGVFGDGAGAVVVRAVEGPSRIGPQVLGCDGGDASAIVAPHPRGPLRIDGGRTFRRAVDTLVEISRRAVRRANLSLDDIDLFVPHQANARITKAVRERLDVSVDRVVDCIADYGNTTGATLPIALAVAHEEGRLQPGSRLLLAAFGAGLTWGALVATWEPEARSG
jgi:3-oxoacyl-[acyl-carrier-protein] synthase III